MVSQDYFMFRYGSSPGVDDVGSRMAVGHQMYPPFVSVPCSGLQTSSWHHPWGRLQKGVENEWHLENFKQQGSAQGSTVGKGVQQQPDTPGDQEEGGWEQCGCPESPEVGENNIAVY